MDSTSDQRERAFTGGLQRPEGPRKTILPYINHAMSESAFSFGGFEMSKRESVATTVHNF
jgi:hypothetical protein